MPRPPGTSAALMKTRARATGRPVSAVSTRPAIRPFAGGVASVVVRWAEVSRGGCCGPRFWPGVCAERAIAVRIAPASEGKRNDCRRNIKTGLRTIRQSFYRHGLLTLGFGPKAFGSACGEQRRLRPKVVSLKPAPENEPDPVVFGGFPCDARARKRLNN